MTGENSNNVLFVMLVKETRYGFSTLVSAPCPHELVMAKTICEAKIIICINFEKTEF